jgi:hypothetical protein
MKNIFLIIGILFILLNSIFGIIISNYNVFNILFVDLSLLLTTLIYYYLYNSLILDGFKIGFTLLFAFTGFIRLMCSFFSPNEIINNFALIFFIILLCIEITLIYIGKHLNNK